MVPQAFQNLCIVLEKHGGLLATQRVLIEEQVAKFLHILAQNVRNRIIPFFFCRSGETINCHFHSVLRAVISLVGKFLRQPIRVQVSPEI